ncbi:MAG: glycosyltransferase family 2 protein [Thermoproteota archaeon]
MINYKNLQKWPSVSVIIVNFNGRELLKKCLESVLESDYLLDKLEIILVDSGSTDGNVEFVKQSF